MSDADDQLGGTGGERGPKPGPEKKNGEETKKQDKEDEAALESFPASDPPGNY